MGCGLKPAITIEPGDRVEFSTLEADWRTGRCTEPKNRERGVFFRVTGRRICAALCGPVYIKEAKPGMTLAVSIGELTRGLGVEPRRTGQSGPSEEDWL